MYKSKTKRGLALGLSACLLLSLCPTDVIAAGYEINGSVTTNTNTAPEAIDKAVWVLTDTANCGLLEHNHSDKCYYKSCDHATATIDGHLQSCYGSGWGECTHSNDDEHTGKVTISISNIGSLSGANAELYDYLVSLYGKRGLYKAYGKSYCYSVDFDNLSCAHVCSEVGGDCYSMYCILPEHAHADNCTTYTWKLKADINSNGIADDEDAYYTVKYVNNGEVIFEESILVDMPTPTVADPTKEADAQYTYTFIGWDSPIAEKVTGDITYTAVYNNAVNKYTVTWVDEDGSVLEVDKDVAYGTIPAYDGEDPSKEGDNAVSYIFAGWTPSVDTVTGNVTYTATYTTKSVYTVQFVIDGETVKTEYIVDGDAVAAYAPARFGYSLSEWCTQDGDKYDFTNAVKGNITLYAEWILEECRVKIKAENASHDFVGDTYKVGENVTINITPNNGYAVDSVTVNDKNVKIVYNDRVASVTFVADDTTEQYEIVAATKRTNVSLNGAEMNVYGDLSTDAIFKAVYDSEKSYPSNLTSDDVTVEYLAYSITLLGRNYEWWTAPNADVSLEGFLDKFGLGSLASYIPASELPHAFGEKSIERVRVSYAGNDKYPQLSASTQVMLKDNRIETKVNLNEGVSVVYGASEDKILDSIFESVTADGTTVTTDADDVTITIDNLNAGAHIATVSYLGDKTYAASTAEVEVVIKKADSYVNVDSGIVKYGQSTNVSSLIDSNANRIEIVAGVAIGDNASADTGVVTRVNLPALIDIDVIENDAVKVVVNKLMEKVTSTISGTMTIGELKSALDTVLPYLEKIEDTGYVSNLNTDAISALLSALDKIDTIDGVGEMALEVSIGKEISISDAGVYVVAGVVADANYNTSFGINYFMITPDGYRTELAWNVEDENGIITIGALKDGYNLGAHVTNVTEGTVDGAEAHLIALFIGANTDGDFIITDDQSELSFGAYTEIAFLADFGNTTYYAIPIVREIIVAADVVDVNFIDQNGDINNDRVFTYGEDVIMNAKAFDRNAGKEITGGTMKYLYTGVQGNGKPYFSDIAPVNSGAYTVIATYIGDNGQELGACVAALAIKPADADFSVDDNAVQYNGKEHFVNVSDNTGLEYVSVVVDGDKNVNVILPSDWEVDTFNVSNGVKELLAKLEKIDIASKLPESRLNILSELKDALIKIEEKIDVNSVVVNGAKPSEVGYYEVTVIAFGNYNYKVTVDTAALTIEPAECAHIAGPAVKENEKSTGCTTTYDLVVYCQECGEELSRESITSTVHGNQHTVIDTFVPAKCNVDGTIVKVHYCSVCNTELDRETIVIPADGITHTPSEAVKENKVEVTETTDGSYDLVVYCSLCGEEINRQTVIVSAPGHTHTLEVIGAVSPTCEANGLTEGTKCSECGEIVTGQDVIPALGHTHETVTGKPANCTENGLTEGIKCSVCDKIITEQTTIPALGHTPADAVRENEIATTETADGSYESVVYCSTCGEEISRDVIAIPVTDNNPDDTEGADNTEDAESNSNTGGAEDTKKPGSTSSPKTGDVANVELWTTVSIVSGMALICMLFIHTKRKETNPE